MKNINVKEYFELSNKFEYDLLLVSLLPENIFDKNINEFTYLDVINLFKFAKKDLSFDNDFVLFSLFFGIEKYQFETLSVTDYFSAKKFTLNFVRTTAERQNKLLSSVNIDNDKWQMCERGRLNKFNDIMPLVQIGEIYGIYPFDLQNKLYSEILSLLVLHKTKKDVQNEFNQMK